MENLQMAANEIEKIKKEWKTKINEMKKHGSALRDIKKWPQNTGTELKLLERCFQENLKALTKILM